MARKAEPKAVPAPVADGTIVDEQAKPKRTRRTKKDAPKDATVDKALEMAQAHPVPDDASDDILENPLVVAARSGNRRELLEALRDHLAVTLATTVSGRDTAALARNLNIISMELDSMPDPEAADTDPVEILRREVMDKQCNG